jgi:acetylornithine/N-succinyldiaminopimelate aminotransferase
MKAVEAAIGPETAAILIEPIQGEGGVRPVPHEQLRKLRSLCDEHGLLLIFDEIQSGMGRTGRFLASEWAGVSPDIATLAKGLGAGFPVGACLATKEASAGMTAGTHGTTFGGNPLAMAVGAAVLDIVMDEAFLERVRRTGLRLKQKLAAVADTHSDLIEEIRGEGLILGIKCRIPNGEVAAAARGEGLLLVPAGDNVVRLLPPLIVGEAEVDEAIERLDRALAGVTRRAAAE